MNITELYAKNNKLKSSKAMSHCPVTVGEYLDAALPGGGMVVVILRGCYETTRGLLLYGNDSR